MPMSGSLSKWTGMGTSPPQPILCDDWRHHLADYSSRVQRSYPRELIVPRRNLTWSTPMPKPDKPVYSLTTYAGASLEALGEQVWDVEWANQFNRTRWKKETLPPRQIKDLVDNGRHVRLPEVKPARFENAEDLPIDAYLLGLLLAEGSLEIEGITFSSGDAEIVERVRGILPDGHSLTSRGVKHRITIGQRGRANKNANLILKGLRDLGLIRHRSWEKFVPEPYKFAAISERLELLRGYLDGDGSIK